MNRKKVSDLKYLILATTQMARRVLDELRVQIPSIRVSGSDSNGIVVKKGSLVADRCG